MQIDIQDFPLVRMDYSGAGKQSIEETLQIFEQCLQRKQAFVFLAGGADFDKDPNESVADRRAVSLWMKQHKAELRDYVKAMYYVEPSSVKRLAAKAFAVIYGKFWGHPMIVTESRDEAVRQAYELLGLSSE
ncbi:hypothetical protein KHQ08_14415 [Pseudochrobactrum algeriensis]|uniref:hypothetical protein n=1 Tax=Pseudochrobactrum algeriensis TaxID=2834768 RepID=UPI001BCC5EEB|nr:hypothetical protein [Pseudochrobactrum algeriensis]MBX8812772.1 hypothetical protein [Ochrobactrum sp. MR34]QVQ36332.1 hypothetical protein KHQ08_14415 [Pseudochrobactrum algeriensis]QVQ39550.1 hypothetical protein KHQ07_12695 [Pseudochrobactrum algeriensis]QVQ43470.1 hypothetical protein KHQ09_14655 [Pseudochrobactrum algeriensis]